MPRDDGFLGRAIFPFDGISQSMELVHGKNDPIFIDVFYSDVPRDGGGEYGMFGHILDSMEAMTK